MTSERLEFPNNIRGIALNLEEDSIGCVLLGDSRGVKEGDIVRQTGKIVEIPVSEKMIGRVLDPLGNPLDEKEEIMVDEFRTVEFSAPSVLERKSVFQPLQTGIKAIDSMIPIGKGQRELIIGDRQTGKTAIAVDTILNQKDTDVICI